VATLRERADRAEAESVARDERARAGERTRIAREMHDVLAHKVSLISVHAGALEVNATAEPHRIEQGATLIRATAQEALEELRAILGVLRDEPGSGTGTCAEDPGPFPDLGRLVASWNEAGADVTLHDETAGVAAVPARTIYRLVQEGLTNAHRHAPGSAVTVTVTGTAAEGVRATVANGPAPEPVAAQAGSGVGLVGLAERFRLVGGTLTSGDDGVGGWRLEGWLPLGPRRNRP
jgi:signal transduction histidine kinase